jgi:hypothetical protein
MASLSGKIRPSQAWNVLPEQDVDSKFLALGLYWNKDTDAIICLNANMPSKQETEEYRDIWETSMTFHRQPGKN